MQINRIIEQTLSEEAVELLDMLAANALVSAPGDAKSVFYLPVEENSWNATLLLLREIYEAEILVAEDSNWVNFRILQSIGVKSGQLAYQFTPTFSQTLR